MPAYKLRFHLPSARDRQDTLARVDIVFTEDAGVLYGLRFSGIIIKEGARSRFEPSKPYVYYPSRFTGGTLTRPYLEADEGVGDLERLTQTILSTFMAWAREEAASLTRDAAPSS